MKLLIENGASVDQTDKDGKTPLMVASENGYADIVKLLIENGAFVNQRDADGETPLILARNADVVQVLLDAGATWDTLCSHNTRDPAENNCLQDPVSLECIDLSGDVFINAHNAQGDYCYTKPYPQMTRDPINRNLRFRPKDVSAIVHRLLHEVGMKKRKLDER